MKIQRCFLLLIFTLLCAPLINAQAIRYELGRRTRAAEIAWDAQPDAAARKRATEHFKQAVTLFFAFKLNDAARQLDHARFALESTTMPANERLWAESLFLSPETRFVNKTETTLSGTLDALYPANVELPKGALVRLTLTLHNQKKAKPIEFAITALPFQLKLPLNLSKAAEGDYTLRTDIVVAGKSLASNEQTISVASNISERLAALKQSADAFAAKTTDTETVRTLTKLLESLAQKKTLETNLPAHRLLNEAEAVVKTINAGQTFYGRQKTGQYWLTLASTNGNIVVRMQAPATARQNKPLPLVVALHGAGGSENMFYDGYGNGAIARLTEARGWLLVSPQGTGMKPERVSDIVDEMAKLYAVDRTKVFVVGHSMGAAQAIAATQLAPEKFAGVAALGGGGAIRNATEALKSLPYFIGIGTEDFALKRAQELQQALQKAEVKKINYREYADIEHLVIVQVALKEVFAFFDSLK